MPEEFFTCPDCGQKPFIAVNLELHRGNKICVFQQKLNSGEVLKKPSASAGEILHTCPDFGHPGFLERGLKAHRGNKTCLKRQAANNPSPAPACEISPVEIPIVMMTASEAEASTAIVKTILHQVNTNLCAVRHELFEVHSREGWKALGHKSFKDYAKAEFGYEKSYTYRLAEAGRVETIIGSDTGLATEQLLAFSDLSDDQIREAWGQARAMSSAVPNPSQIKYAVGSALGIQPKAPKKPKAPAAAKPQESLQVVLKPMLGTSEVKWGPRRAEGVTVQLHLNRDTDLNAILSRLGDLKTLVETAIADFTKAEGVPLSPQSATESDEMVLPNFSTRTICAPQSEYATTLTPENHTDY